MINVKDNNSNNIYRSICIVMIWCIAAYSYIIQHKYSISNMMLILGAAILVFYILANGNKPFDFLEALSKENICMLFFMAYMLLVGLLFSPNQSSHMGQWITCMEYLFLQIVITSIIKESGTDTFHILLLAVAILLAIVFLRNPVNYANSGRYSISNEVNPNSLGMTFAAGIWAVFYQQQNKKFPLILVSVLVGLFGYCILLTGSRKSLIAAELVAVLWLLFYFLPSLKGRGFFLGITAFLMVVFLIIIIGRELIGFYADSTIAARMDNLKNEVSEGSRSEMYRQGYELLKTNLLFGIGFQGFRYYYGTYSHATLIEVPVSGGIIGALLYSSAYFFSIRKTLFLYKKTKDIAKLSNEHLRVKMIMILWAVMLFYTICIIHPYQFDSCILFGIIFGETSYIESRLNSKQEVSEIRTIGSKYIRYE